MGENMAICPLSLLFKDHKGWTVESGTVPPTRPVVGGHVGINVHISEIVSDILDPVVDNYVGSREVISTEDLLARVELLNEKNKNWSTLTYWGELIEEEYRSCGVCLGTEDYVWDENKPELCVCDEMDTIDDQGRVMITASAMRALRRHKWEILMRWDPTDKDRIITASEALPEDVQDRSLPMIVIGSDVVNLYPSLDIQKIVGLVKQSLMDTTIEWEEVDYLEGARYIALNWTEEA